jgi:hypothetical protein
MVPHSSRTKKCSVYAVPNAEACAPELLQLRVLGPGLMVDGYVGVGVLPEGEEVLVCTLRSNGVACHRIRSTDLEMSQCPQWAVRDEAAVLHEFLELVSGFMWLVQREVRLHP